MTANGRWRGLDRSDEFRSSVRGFADELLFGEFVRKIVDPGIRIDGFLCPGHVSSILGTAPYEPVARDHGIPCVVAGFEPLQILAAVEALLQQRADGRSVVENRYPQAVPTEGNPAAREILDRDEPNVARQRGTV